MDEFGSASFEPPMWGASVIEQYREAKKYSCCQDLLSKRFRLCYRESKGAAPGYLDIKDNRRIHAATAAQVFDLEISLSD